MDRDGADHAWMRSAQESGTNVLSAFAALNHFSRRIGIFDGVASDRVRLIARRFDADEIEAGALAQTRRLNIADPERGRRCHAREIKIISPTLIPTASERAMRLELPAPVPASHGSAHRVRVIAAGIPPAVRDARDPSA